MSFQSFLNEVRRGLPSPLYLFAVSNPFLCQEAIEAIKELVPVDARDFNLHMFDFLNPEAENVTLEQVLSVAKTASFFGGKRFTVMTGNIQKFLKNDLEKLIAYSAKPPDDSVLVILHLGALSKTAKEQFKAFKPVSIDMRYTEIPQWITTTLKSRGIDISDDAVEYLLSLVGFDPGLLSAEIEKIAFTGLKTIDTHDITDIVAGGRQHGIFDLVNALKAQNADKVFRIYKSLKETSDDYSLIGALNWQYARLSGERMNRREKDYLLNIFDLLHQADIEIKSSGRHFPVEYLLVRLLRLQKLRSPSG